MITRANENSLWSKPKNLGSDINTAGDELFPFIHPNGTLYFASNGRRGMGGLDIFKAVPTDINKWGQVENMKYPINSGYNDYSIVFEDENDRGYLTSNRPGTKGQSDILNFMLASFGLYSSRKYLRQRNASTCYNRICSSCRN